MTTDESFTFELVNQDGAPLLDKVQRLKEVAAFRSLECTGVMHPAKNSVTVTFKPKPLPPVAVRVRLLLKAALRSYGLRAIAKELHD